MCILMVVVFIFKSNSRTWLIFFCLICMGDKKIIIPCVHVWLDNSCLFIILQIWLFGLCFVFLLPRPGRLFSETWISMKVEVCYIFYGYLFGFYFFYWQPWCLSTITGFIKRTDFYIFFVLIHISQILNSWPKFKSDISYGLCYVLGLYFASSIMWNLSTYF